MPPEYWNDNLVFRSKEEEWVVLNNTEDLKDVEKITLHEMAEREDQEIIGTEQKEAFASVRTHLLRW
jgi:hypothetical protein